ncbi:hypothetical protein psal_cds_612 [Pandoravirus salinus]|uniref:Uncharacterized protein n=1 Tax=Pandoravirus salinus TaxID=1349410 RepID=S4W2R9_9VIRU|nr:hypothetical protein psal_cds_612 [Pandoravirus salinus]AGO84490.1 hypothetical protein psal_cds_612 [Pandoravirus salinus]
MSRSNTRLNPRDQFSTCRRPADDSVHILGTWLGPDAFKTVCAFDALLASNHLARAWSVPGPSNKPYSRPFSLLDQDDALSVILRLHVQRAAGWTDPKQQRQERQGPTVHLVTDSKYPVPTIRFVLPSPDKDDNVAVAAEPRTTFGDLYGWLPAPQFNQAVALRSALRATRDLHHSWVPWRARADDDVQVAFPYPHEARDPVRRLMAWVRAYACDQAHNGDGCVFLTVGHNGQRPILCMRRLVIPRATDYGSRLFARAARIAMDPSRVDIAALYPHIDSARVDAFETIDVMMPIHHAPHRWAPMSTVPPADAQRTPGRLSAMDGTSLLMAHSSAARAAPGVPQRLVFQPEKDSGAFLWYWSEPLTALATEATPTLPGDGITADSPVEQDGTEITHGTADRRCRVSTTSPPGGGGIVDTPGADDTESDAPREHDHNANQDAYHAENPVGEDLPAAAHNPEACPP